MASETSIVSQSASVAAAAVSANALSAIPHLAAPVAIGQLPTMQQLPIRDPEWLKLEVCREFQRGACKRTSEECKYAHPGKNIQIMPDGKVIACFDALKSRCSRESCKYLHPPGHLKQQLEINGRNNLIQQRAMLQMMPQTILQTPVQQQAVQVSSAQPMLTSLQPAAAVSANHLYNPAVAAASSPAYTMLPTGEIALANSHLLYYPNTAVATTAHQMSLASPAPQVTAITSHMGASRADRLEVCRDFLRGNCTRGEHECRYAHPDDRSMIDLTDNSVTVCMDCIKGRCTRDKCKYFHPPPHLQAKIRASQHQAAYLPIAASPGMASPQPPVVSNNNATNALGQPPIKRHALDNKILTQQQATISGTLVPSTNATQTLYGNYGLQLHQAAPQFYHQLPMLSMYGGASPANLQTPTALSTVTLPTANGQPSPASSTLALLNGQSQQPTTMETLTVCRDYQSGKCTRPVCRFVHVTEDFVEIKDDKVAVCKNALLGKCNRPQCRFYHYPTSDPSSYISPYTPSVHLPPVEAMTPPNSSILCSQTATAVMMDPQTTVYAHPVNQHTPVYTDLPAGI